MKSVAHVGGSHAEMKLMLRELQNGYTILAPGFAKWWGSDARALAQALRHLGNSVLEVDE